LLPAKIQNEKMKKEALERKDLNWIPLSLFLPVFLPFPFSLCNNSNSRVESRQGFFFFQNVMAILISVEEAVF